MGKAAARRIRKHRRRLKQNRPKRGPSGGGRHAQPGGRTGSVLKKRLMEKSGSK